MRKLALIVLAGSIALCGCATVKRQAVPTVRITGPAAPATEPAPATKPSGKADVALDQITPMPTLGAPSSRPAEAGRPPVEALVLFAKARDAMIQGQRFTAVNLLEQAAKEDPDSYEVRYELGQAYGAGAGSSSEQSIAAYEAAARIEPDHIAVHEELGRQYLAKGDVTRALDHLLLARQTSDYDTDDEAAAVVDFYLGKTLQQAGYDRAALECYQKLIARLQSGALNTRSSPELAYLAQQPEPLYITAGELLEKRGQPDEAALLYELAADRQPGEFSYQAHLVRGLLAAGKQDEATQRATAAVRQFHNSPDSLALLKEVFARTGGDDALAAELRRLRRERPDDRTLLYALVDVLSAQGKTADATKLLEDAARSAKYETELTRRLFKLYDSADQVDDAARLLIEALAARPDNTRDVTAMWQQLLRPWRRNHLTVTRLQALKVPPAAEASKQFWVAEMARIWNREALSRSALELAVKEVPPFSPAYRALIAQYWSRDDWDENRKRDASEKLIASLERQGDAVLAAELRGLMLANANEPAKAAEQFAKAQQLGNDGPDLRLSYANALQAAGESDRAEQVLWKLAKDQPTVEESFLQLFQGYLKRGQTDRAVSTLKTWLVADPSSVNAQILESTIYFRAGHVQEAEKTLTELFEREPDNGDVLAAMAAFYSKTNRTDDFIAKLEAQRQQHPENRTAVEQLVLLYAAQHHLPEALRVLDASRAAAKDDPDLLYYIANLYTRVGQKDISEQVLEQVVRIDPRHAPACNDLGYNWADQGKNLARAESLIRTAVEVEPDNGSFLDSLGWVLYKRGKFGEARAALEGAIKASSFPDPVVLDHLGDTLYRLDDKSQAEAQWKQSQERLIKESPTTAAAAAAGAGGDDAERDDLKQLRLQLQQKIKQAEAGQPAAVAPVAEEPAKQAKN